MFITDADNHNPQETHLNGTHFLTETNLDTTIQLVQQQAYSSVHFALQDHTYHILYNDDKLRTKLLRKIAQLMYTLLSNQDHRLLYSLSDDLTAVLTLDASIRAEFFKRPKSTYELCREVFADPNFVLQDSNLQHVPSTEVTRLLPALCNPNADATDLTITIATEDMSPTALPAHVKQLFQDLARLLQDQHCKITSLAILHLEPELTNIIPALITTLGTGLTHPHCKLVKLHLDCGYSNPAAIVNLNNILAKKSCNLQAVSFNFGFTDNDALTIANTLRSPDCNVTELQVSAQHLGADGIAAIATAIASPNCKLTKLGVARTNSKLDVNLLAVLQACNTPGCKLTTLDLSNNHLDDACVTAIIAGLNNPACALNDINLAQTDISLHSQHQLLQALQSASLAKPCTIRMPWPHDQATLDALVADLQNAQFNTSEHQHVTLLFDVPPGYKNCFKNIWYLHNIPRQAGITIKFHTARTVNNNAGINELADILEAKPDALIKNQQCDLSTLPDNVFIDIDIGALRGIAPATRQRFVTALQSQHCPNNLTIHSKNLVPELAAVVTKRTESTKRNTKVTKKHDKAHEVAKSHEIAIVTKRLCITGHPALEEATRKFYTRVTQELLQSLISVARVVHEAGIPSELLQIIVSVFKIPPPQTLYIPLAPANNATTRLYEIRNQIDSKPAIAQDKKTRSKHAHSYK